MHLQLFGELTHFWVRFRLWNFTKGISANKIISGVDKEGGISCVLVWCSNLELLVRLRFLRSYLMMTFLRSVHLILISAYCFQCIFEELYFCEAPWIDCKNSWYKEVPRQIMNNKTHFLKLFLLSMKYHTYVFFNLWQLRIHFFTATASRLHHGYLDLLHPGHSPVHREEQLCCCKRPIFPATVQPPV